MYNWLTPFKKSSLVCFQRLGVVSCTINMVKVLKARSQKALGKLHRDISTSNSALTQTRLQFKPIIKFEIEDSKRSSVLIDCLPRIHHHSRVKSDLETLTADLIVNAIAENEEVQKLTSSLAAASGNSQKDVISRVKKEVSEVAVEDLISVKLEKEDLEDLDPTKQLKNATRQTSELAGEKRHRAARSNVERPFECSFCEKAFKRRAHLQTHENAHRGIKPFKCKHCDRAFTDRNAQVCHERLHDGIKPYACEECGRKFTQRSDYVKHSRTHTGERTHQCRYCDAKFIGSSNLIVHERGHTGERPHKCDKCKATFSKHGDLTRHQRIHTGERPYECKYCTDRFTQPAHRRVHEMAHLKVKPHKCRYCSTSFLRIGDLNRHEKRHPQFTGTLKRRNEISRVNKTEIESDRAESQLEKVILDEDSNSEEPSSDWMLRIWSYGPDYQKQWHNFCDNMRCMPVEIMQLLICTNRWRTIIFALIFNAINVLYVLKKYSAYWSKCMLAVAVQVG